jgi:hypothetical protein
MHKTKIIMASAMLLIAGPLSAEVAIATIDKAFVNTDTGATRMEGKVSCTEGQELVVDGQLIQGQSYDQYEAQLLICRKGPTQWSLFITEAEQGPPIQPGTAQGEITARTPEDGDSVLTTSTVKVKQEH